MANKCSCTPTVDKDEINFGNLSPLYDQAGDWIGVKTMQFEFWIYKCEKCNVLWLHQWQEHDTLETLMSASEWGEIKEYICSISEEEFVEIKKIYYNMDFKVKGCGFYKLSLFKGIESFKDREIINLSY